LGLEGVALAPPEEGSAEQKLSTTAVRMQNSEKREKSPSCPNGGELKQPSWKMV
jgi:hypothetical protein